MKTKKQWIKSSLDLDEYLTELCRIDEDLYLYIGEIVAPSYCACGLVQSGEAEKHEDHVPFYMSASLINNKYFYLGILPKFKQ